MDRRPEGIAETWRRLVNIYREDGVGGVLSGLRTRFINDVFFRRFEWWQRNGVHVTPVGPWTPIPDTRELSNEIWDRPADLPSIDINESEQLSLLSTLREKYADEYIEFPLGREGRAEPDGYFVRNGTFETVDGEVLYGLVREREPERIVQAGGGFSTRAIIRAIHEGGIDCEVKVFEPCRDDELYQNSPGQCELVGAWAEEADTTVFDQLGPGDILFVDSAHVIRTGNHVSSLLFDVLSRIQSGVLVHFHDIFLPYEYPKEWVLGRKMFLNEQYAVRCFLEFNSRFEIRWMGSYMHENHHDRLASAFESYEQSRISFNDGMNIPNSLWLRKTAP